MQNFFLCILRIFFLKWLGNLGETGNSAQPSLFGIIHITGKYDATYIGGPNLWRSGII